jgi:hypothetical protein
MTRSRPASQGFPGTASATAPRQDERNRKVGGRFIPSSSTVAAFFLGAALLVVSAELYSNVVSPVRAPIVPGHAELYVQDQGVTADLSVTFPLKSRDGESQVIIGVAFTSVRQVPDVSWALVMSGDACFAERGECITSVNGTTSTFLPQGAKATLVKIGQPPFSKHSAHSRMVIGSAGLAGVTGRMPAPVVARACRA